MLEAATVVIAGQGLSAPTAVIAKQAGVSNGSLFVYFTSKAALLNELYVCLKTEMGAAATDGLPAEGPPREQLRHLWTGWLGWATANPDKRRALAHLDVADDITAESRQAVHDGQRAMADLVDRCRSGGPLDGAPLRFVLALISALADTTTDVMIREPGEAAALSEAAFDAVWRVLAGRDPSGPPARRPSNRRSTA